MKALAKLKKEPGLWLTDVDEPIIKNKDVLIKIKKTAICGTDLHIYKWDEWSQKRVPVPLVTGHEFYGEVVGVGSEVTAFKIGDRVSGEGHLTCGVCRNCRAGARHLCRKTEGVGYDVTGCFSEYFAMPESNVYSLSHHISDDVASILDPLGNATHAALHFDCVGEDVLVTGAGPVGLMAAAIAKHVGARHVVITDVNEYRLSLAKKLGISLAINIKEKNLRTVMKELGMREGFDIGMEMSGNSDAFCNMLDVMNHGGRIAFMGIPPNDFAISWDQVVFKSLVIAGIYGRRMFETWYKMDSILSSGLNVAPVITHHFKVDDYEKAFDAMLSGKAGKVILEW